MLTHLVEEPFQLVVDHSHVRAGRFGGDMGLQRVGEDAEANGIALTSEQLNECCTAVDGELELVELGAVGRHFGRGQVRPGLPLDED